MIVVDAEYTCWEDSLRTGWSDPARPREIVQIAAVRVDDAFRETEAFEAMALPVANPVLSPFFQELTGIGQVRLEAEGAPFAAAFAAFRRFVGDEPVVCMNGDETVMRECAARAGVAFDLPSFHRLRPLLAARGLDVAGLSSGDLHALTPTPLEGRAHDALHDVRSMAAWLAHERAEGRYRGPDDLPTGAPDVDPRVADALAGRR